MEFDTGAALECIVQARRLFFWTAGHLIPLYLIVAKGTSSVSLYCVIDSQVPGPKQAGRSKTAQVHLRLIGEEITYVFEDRSACEAFFRSCSSKCVLSR